MWRYDGALETGGGMYGPRQWSWRGFQIDDATEIADSKTYSGASLGMRALDEYERRGRTSDDSSVLQGVWHSQPTDTRPSPADLFAFRCELDRIRARHHVQRQIHLIVAPGRDGWLRPEVAGYVVRRDAHDGVVCEPADVVVPR